MSSSPANSPQEAVTRLLIEWKSGNKEALDLLTPIVYDELRRLADHYLRNEHAAATLQPTALVHEAYLRLVAQSLPDWESRSHFFGGFSIEETAQALDISVATVGREQRLAEAWLHREMSPAGPSPA